jgi:hypothetical protein
MKKPSKTIFDLVFPQLTERVRRLQAIARHRPQVDA